MLYSVFIFIAAKLAASHPTKVKHNNADKGDETQPQNKKMRLADSATNTSIQCITSRNVADCLGKLYGKDLNIDHVDVDTRSMATTDVDPKQAKYSFMSFCTDIPLPQLAKIRNWKPTVATKTANNMHCGVIDRVVASLFGMPANVYAKYINPEIRENVSQSKTTKTSQKRFQMGVRFIH